MSTTTNIAATVTLDGVVQKHVRGYSTKDGWVKRRKLNANGTVVVNPVTRVFVEEVKYGQVEASAGTRTLS